MISFADSPSSKEIEKINQENASLFREEIGYKPLISDQSIRLLELLPAEDDAAPVTCVMNTQDRASADLPPYTALSYTWGDTRNTSQISINGQPVIVTENLLVALQHLRRAGFRTLWVDALCINQADIAERTHQVKQMAEIYRGAERVIAWLGPSGDDSDTVFLAIERTGRLGSDFETSGLMEWLEGDTRFITAVQSLLERPYWERAWIIQEVVLAKHVQLMCGLNFVPWLAFDVFLGHLLHIGHYINSLRTIMGPLVKSAEEAFSLVLLKRRQDQRIRLYSLLQFSKHAKANDSRDKIFALVGLVRGTSTRTIEPSYQSSPCEVFCETLRVVVKDLSIPESGTSRHGLDFWLLREIKKRRSVPGDALLHATSVAIIHKGQRGRCDGIGCGTFELCFKDLERDRMFTDEQLVNLASISGALQQSMASPF